MACPHVARTVDLLRTESGTAAAMRGMEHLRGCRECRVAFRMGAAALAPETGAGPVHPENVRTPPPVAPRPVELIPTAPRRPWRGRNLMILIGLAVLILGFGSGRLGRQAAATGATDEAQWRVALANGTPVCLAPQGDHEGRPRAFSGLVPPGVTEVTAILLDASGKPVFVRTYRSGDGACCIDDMQLDGGGEKFRAGRVAIPFPPAADTPLAPGVAYGAILAVPGGHASASAPFRLNAGSGDGR